MGKVAQLNNPEAMWENEGLPHYSFPSCIKSTSSPGPGPGNEDSLYEMVYMKYLLNPKTPIH